jgi:hypothetical protein
MRVLFALVVVTAPAVTGCIRCPADEVGSASIGELRTADQALREYHALCGAYPASLEALREPKDAAGVPQTCSRFGNLAASVVDHAAAGTEPFHGRKHGLVYVPEAGRGLGFQGYRLEAPWLGRGSPERSFWTSDSGVITMAHGRPATEYDEPLR